MNNPGLKPYQSPETTCIVPCGLPLEFTVRWLLFQVLDGWGWKATLLAELGGDDFDAYPVTATWRPISTKYPHEFLLFKDWLTEREWELNGATGENEDGLLHVIILEREVTFIHPRANELGDQLMKTVQANWCFALAGNNAQEGGC